MKLEFSQFGINRIATWDHMVLTECSLRSFMYNFDAWEITDSPKWKEIESLEVTNGFFTG